MNLDTLNKIASSFTDTEPMPVLFVGHGNPMNAIEENEFTKGWANAARAIPRPNAIVCISAHWQTDGTFVTAMPKPQTIHDFGGFPPALYQVQYPAPGDPELASDVKSHITKIPVGLSNDWGLDHGCWVVASRLYPKADVPVIQLSLNYGKPAQWHYDLAKELAYLRRKGILIMGSGNIVHNLARINWSDNKTFDWAIEAHNTIKKLTETHDHQSLVNYQTLGTAVNLAVPTPEHFLPLLYTLALQEDKDTISYFNDKTVMGSIDMTCLKIG